MPEQVPTIKTVAQAAGVSVSTVQSALYGTGRLSAATRERVRAVAEELGYRPNRLARALRSGRSSLLGVILRTTKADWDAHLMEGIEEAGASHGYTVLLGFRREDEARERALVESFWRQGAEGLIVFPRPGPDSACTYRRVLAAGVKVVWVSGGGPVEADVVDTDHRRGGYLVGRHLAALGRRRVVHLRHESLLDAR